MELHRNFKISSRSHHGVVFITELSRAEGDRPVSVRVIAQRMGLSEKYLEELVRALRAAGLVSSMRGRTGGYRLSKAPNAMTMGEIVRALEGPVVLAHCQDAGADAACPQEGTCASKKFFQRLKQTIDTELDRMTLQDFSA
ncbi:MAG: Rrf2 family transcriptional regulator [bacterium]|nr:Rrf2 family transcriptional regulator [bacterium]